MNKEWSEALKSIQQKMKKDTFAQAICELKKLRCDLFEELMFLRTELSEKEFAMQPFINSKGYHNKTIAYSIWHMYRIEDIVLNTLINRREQVFFAGNYKSKIGADTCTTGNELVGEEIRLFSEKLNIDALFEYANEVRKCTDAYLDTLSYSELKRKFSEEDKDRLKAKGCVSEDELALWLIDYWCNKDVRGLILMPFSRHLISHTEAALRIRNGLKKDILKKFEFRHTTAEDGDSAVKVEQTCFPPNEACSEARMRERVVKISDQFLVAVDKKSGEIAGFINGMATDEDTFKDEFFTDIFLNNPKGANVMIMGFAIMPKYRGSGLARELMYNYLYLERQKGRKNLILTCLDEKVEMYAKMRYIDNGEATSQWGGESWHEMNLRLTL